MRALNDPLSPPFPTPLQGVTIATLANLVFQVSQDNNIIIESSCVCVQLQDFVKQLSCTRQHVTIKPHVVDSLLLFNRV